MSTIEKPQSTEAHRELENPAGSWRGMGRTPMGLARSAVDFSQPDRMLVRYEVSTDGKVGDCLFEGVYERQG